jgi:Tol biopolymer transport system component
MFVTLNAAAVILVGMVGVGVYLATTPSRSAPASGPAPLSEPGEWIVFEHFGQAPDGSTTQLDFDRRQIWLTRPDGSGLHELAPGRPADGKVSPDVSPDGTRVVFSTWTPRSLLFETPIDGGEPQLLSKDCSGLPEECQEWDPAYAPDGTRVAFVRYDVPEGRGRFPDGWPASRIGIRDLASGEDTWLESTRLIEAEGWLNQPTWSPDGKQVAYHVAATPRNEGEYPRPTTIWIADVETDAARRLATPDVAHAADPDWSPDGTRIVYSTVGFRESEGGPPLTPQDDIYTIRPDGTGNELICDGAMPVEGTPGGGCWAPSWMPGGEEILYWGYQTWNLMSADGTDKRRVSPDGRLAWFGDRLGFGYSAVWQPRLVEE